MRASLWAKAVQIVHDTEEDEYLLYWSEPAGRGDEIGQFTSTQLVSLRRTIDEALALRQEEQNG